MDVVGDEGGGGDAGGEEGVLVGLGGRETHGFRSSASWAPSEAETVSQRNVGPMGMSLLFTKPRMVV